MDGWKVGTKCCAEKRAGDEQKKMGDRHRERKRGERQR